MFHDHFGHATKFKKLATIPKYVMGITNELLPKIRGFEQIWTKSITLKVGGSHEVIFGRFSLFHEATYANEWDNWLLGIDEPVEFENNPLKSRLKNITDHSRGSYRIYLNSSKKNQKISTCNRLKNIRAFDLETLGSRPLMPRNFLGQCHVHKLCARP